VVNKIVALTVDENFHVVLVTKGDIHETKLQTKSEEHFRAVSKYLEEASKSFYTYQLKSSKGLQVVLKGIEPDVTAKEVIDALKEKGFSAKNVSNIINRKKEPQPLFRVELEPKGRVLKKNEVHRIYSLQYLLHRRIIVEEPRKRNGPVQCTSCQEYVHTRAYCSFRTVWVTCEDFHNSANCPANKEDPEKKKCVNCQGNHTSNYKGCPIYKEMKDRMRKVTATRHQNTQNAYTYSRTTPEVFFCTAARSSFGQLNTQKGFSYADALRSGTENPLRSNLRNAQQIQVQSQSTLESMMVTKQQSAANTGSKPEHGDTATCR